MNSAKLGAFVAAALSCLVGTFTSFAQTNTPVVGTSSAVSSASPATPPSDTARSSSIASSGSAASAALTSTPSDGDVTGLAPASAPTSSVAAPSTTLPDGSAVPSAGDGTGAVADSVNAEPVSDVVPSAADENPDEPDLTEDADVRAFSDFDGELAPHGRWVDDAEYGTVWVPHAHVVGAGFAPYVTAGHWALSPGGQWVWVSDYPFGWVVFHYGRWVHVPGYGFAWIPGRRYAPAWVVFRTSVYGDPYLGWGPMPPRYIYRRGRVVWLSRVPPVPYVFCRSDRLFHRHMGTHVIREHRHTRALAQRSRAYTYSSPTVARRTGPGLREAGVKESDRAPERVTKTRRLPSVRNQRAANDAAPKGAASKGSRPKSGASTLPEIPRKDVPLGPKAKAKPKERKEKPKAKPKKRPPSTPPATKPERERPDTKPRPNRERPRPSGERERARPKENPTRPPASGGRNKRGRS
jgi:hypothetical protein